MANTGRKLGANIFTIMQSSGISREDLAQKINYTYRDVCRMIEGKLILPPIELSRIADVLGTTKADLMNLNSDNLAPELQYMKAFQNSDNLDKILDLLDEYIELKEMVCKKAVH